MLPISSTPFIAQMPGVGQAGYSPLNSGTNHNRIPVMGSGNTIFGGGDTVEISSLYSASRTGAQLDVMGIGSQEETRENRSGGGQESSSADAGEEKAADGSELSEEEKQTVQELKDRDREVRQHEQAHIAAGAGYAGAASYSYQRGPDGNNYAVGGEVSIDTSPEGDPEATAAKMRIVRAAALAPANPSGQDMAVAAAASKAEMQATQEARQQDAEEAEARRTENAEAAEEATGNGEEQGENAPVIGESSQPGSETSDNNGVTAEDVSGVRGNESSVEPSPIEVGDNGGLPLTGAALSTNSESGRARAAYGGGQASRPSLIDLVA